MVTMPLWHEVEYEGKPAELAIRVRYQPGSDDMTVTGVQIERTDGRAVMARDLREVKLLPPTRRVAGEPAIVAGYEKLACNRRYQRVRDDDNQHRVVWDLWLQARRVAPRAPTQWMLRRLDVSEATARRWIKQAREHAASQGWEAPRQWTIEDVEKSTAEELTEAMRVGLLRDLGYDLAAESRA